MNLSGIGFLIVALLSTQLVYPQSEREDLLLFEKATTLHSLVYKDYDFDREIAALDSIKAEDKIKIELLNKQKIEILEIALDTYEEMLEKFPASRLKFRAMSNAAELSLELNYEDKAIAYYEEIINSDANDQERGGLGEGIMAEPYALYKNRACKKLARLHIENEAYASALKYLKLTEKYPYQHFCGNEYAADEIYMAYLYGKTYAGMRNIEKSLSHLLPHIFNFDLANNDYLVELSIDVLLENYGLEEVKNQFLNGLENITIKKKKRGNQYIFSFMGHEIEIHSFRIDIAADKKVAAREVLLNCHFHLLLTKP